ncbi:hypothetical protein GH714_042903 [Hevea brasiliensis]|uniref:Uncharacterized protein n=1 Tax=Hevea brasiliensis TaxID=3981 RepID=A0A6A6K3U7_HEVBR|nr:hypothetical protein GH714_042903 [Hevea brasiliensis]
MVLTLAIGVPATFVGAAPVLVPLLYKRRPQIHLPSGLVPNYSKLSAPTSAPLTRIEAGIGHERFVIKGGKKSNEDTASVFLLGKELAYDTARGQVDRLTNALGKMTKSEAKKWGTAVEGATGGGDALSRKVCGTAGSSGSNCGTADDTAFLLGKELALDTARGQLLSSALGRMSMSDVHRLKREVVDSEGIASPVRAMFSRQIPDGDTLLAGEMAGVDDGLVIQELSRPEELEKLQHELAKQVSKLAELGELKWLERLEAIETEELQEMKERLRLKARRASEELRTQLERLESDLGLLEVKKLKEVKLEKKLDAEGLKAAVEKLREVGKELEEKKLEELKTAKKEVVTKVGLKELEALGLEDEIKLEGIEAGKELELAVQKLEKLEKWRPASKEKVGELKNKLEELAAIRELRRELAELGVLSAEFKEWEKLEKEGKEPELVQKLKVLGTDIMGALEEKKLEEVKEAKSAVVTKIGKLGGAFEKIEEKKPAELEKTWLFKKLGKLEELKKLGGTVEELAAIRELKTNPELAELRLGALSLEEQLRTLAEIKEVKALVESRKDRGLEIQEGLQLTERIRGLERRLVLEGIKELTLLEAQRIRSGSDPQAVKKAASMLEEISVLRELRQLDELIPEEQLRTLAEVKGTIAAQKLTVEHKKKELIKEMKELVGKREAQPWLQGQAELKGKEIAKLGKLVKEIKALEELTEIAEKRGVATTLKAALANAMETTKNRVGLII